MNALIVIDVQNDFCPGGALAVTKGDSIIPIINGIMPQFEHIILTQDWHPSDHLSFASNHQNKSPYDLIDAPYGEQVLWPDHCIQGSTGAQFHPNLDSSKAQLIVRKGFRTSIDSYSAFFENDKVTSTGLHGFLTSLHIRRLFLCGLATDFCVFYSAIDAINLGFEVVLITDAVKGIDLNNSIIEATNDMGNAGVTFITSKEIIDLENDV